jgi:hypothetical protein
MRAKTFSIITLLAVLALTLSRPATASVGATLAIAPQAVAPQAKVTEALHSSPVMFIQNVGQFDKRALFQVRGGDKTIWLAEDAIWVTVVEEPHPTPRLPDSRHPWYNSEWYNMSGCGRPLPPR